jgi:hypothetical protein
MELCLLPHMAGALGANRPDQPRLRVNADFAARESAFRRHRLR